MLTWPAGSRRSFSGPYNPKRDFGSSHSSVEKRFVFLHLFRRLEIVIFLHLLMQPAQLEVESLEQ